MEKELSGNRRSRSTEMDEPTQGTPQHVTAQRSPPYRIKQQHDSRHKDPFNVGTYSSPGSPCGKNMYLPHRFCWRFCPLSGKIFGDTTQQERLGGTRWLVNERLFSIQGQQESREPELKFRLKPGTQQYKVRNSLEPSGTFK